MLFLSSLIGILLLSFVDSTEKTYVSLTDPTVNYSKCNHKEVDFMLYSSSLTKKSRIFLLGDSLIGQMCRDTKFCGKLADGSLYTVNLTPNVTSPTNWSYFRMHYLNGAPKVQIFHLGQYGGQIYIFEKELFSGFHPKANDILILLFGAHFHDPRSLESFVSKAYERIASKFLGRVYWLEPFPQHFKLGTYDRDIETKTKHIDCYELTPERNATQFWKPKIVRNIVKETDRIKLIRSYDILASMDRCHKEVQFLQKNGNRDCTHYNNIAYSHVWRAVSLAMLRD